MSSAIKNRRREEILDIVKHEDIVKQEELAVKLKRRGIAVTQTTLSRDLREMNIVRKSTGDKEYKYVLAIDEDVTKRCQRVFKEVVTSIFIQEYFVLIKTMSGTADAVGELIDRLDDRRIVGTVAGKNNILVLCKNIKGAKQVFKELNDLRM